MESDAALDELVLSLAETRALLTCAACRKPFSNPVKYLTCLHTVCASHTGEKGNKFCAVCRADVRGSSTVPDPVVQEMWDAVSQLQTLFKKETEKTKTSTTTSKSALAKGQRKKSITDTSKASLEKKNVRGETPLHVACRSLKMEKILELLSKGANPNTRDHAGWTPLHEVTQKGSLEAVQLLLSHKALSDIPGLDNETPLHEAVRYKHKDIAIELVKYGANVNSKNIKGETPLSLSEDDMKTALLNAGDDIVQSQSENIKEISLMQMTCDFENMHVLCLAPYRTVVQKLKKLAKKHSIDIETKFSNKITHLIVETEEDNTAASTLEIFQAVVNGIWILNSDWVMKSTDDHLENFEEYEIAGIFSKDNDGPRKARYSRYKKQPGLFDGCHFYLHNFQKEFEISKTLVLTKTVLSKIITDAGGKVLKRVPNPEAIPQSEKTVPYHAREGSKLAKCSHYIIFHNIFEPMYNMDHLKALPIGWLMECIQKYDICDP